MSLQTHKQAVDAKRANTFTRMMIVFIVFIVFLFPPTFTRAGVQSFCGTDTPGWCPSCSAPPLLEPFSRHPPLGGAVLNCQFRARANWPRWRVPESRRSDRGVARRVD